ncbi:hypothetical protein [Kitasatospora sp. NPDC087314]|uniref:MmyB family transcriptional regulator n=1 Tax=Kitasatospora sp. NPDC087314 TaxID=3364068 RepID=UPI00382D1E71
MAEEHRAEHRDPDHLAELDDRHHHAAGVRRVLGRHTGQRPGPGAADALPRMVAVLWSAYGRHVGEPAWEEHVRRLAARSGLFRELWERQEVAPPEAWLRVFRHPQVGVLNLKASYLTIPGVPECYIVAYVPIGPEDQARVEQLGSLPPGGGVHTCHP